MNQWRSYACVFALLIGSLGAVNCSGLQPDLQADLDVWSSPSIPQAVLNRQGPPGEGPVLLDKPWDSSRYAHRQGELSVQLPEGAHSLRLKLRSHEDFVFGTAFSPETVPASDLEWYEKVTLSLFNGLTPENRFKWPLYERSPGAYQQAQQVLEQQYISFAQAANYSLVRGHTLEWGKVGPFWAHKLSCDAYVAALKERVTRDVKLFKGKFNQYDVFNEIIESPGMLSKCNLWDTAFPDAFKWAHEADPQAQLCINDLSLIEAHNAPELIRIIKQHLWAHGAPIHCIGIQTHFEHHGVNLTYQQEKLDLLATLGLDLIITEFSLFSTWSGPQGHPISYLDEDTQAGTTVDLFRLWFSHPAVKGIIMWGWWDGNIWITNAGIYKADKQPKKAALAIQDLWQSELSTSLEVKLPESSWTKFKGFYGLYDYEFTTAGGQSVRGSVELGRNSPQQSLARVV